MSRCFIFSVSWSDPLYILTHSKCVLNDAINRDAKFLEKNDVMDYSLLVGCASGKLLVLGIIGKRKTERWRENPFYFSIELYFILFIFQNLSIQIIYERIRLINVLNQL